MGVSTGRASWARAEPRFTHFADLDNQSDDAAVTQVLELIMEKGIATSLHLQFLVRVPRGHSLW